MPNIGKYEIESRIGRGGMGDVYRAFDPTLRRRVAIKVLKVEGDPETLSRFRLEATSAGNLNHRNIVTIYDYGDFEGEPYIVMEYLEGEDLQRTIDSGKKFDLVEITDIMSQVADALECAHQHGVIHRDVKPANIMLVSRGGIKLMDFGIARLAGSNTAQTKVGHIVGTVLYMSPEQFHNMELDRRVDIWAYGVIYYQLLCGKHPFQVPDQIVTMYNIANKPAAPICSLNQEVPEALGQIVDRCLSKDRDQRYSTMEDLRFDVLPVLQDLSRQQAARMIGEARKMVDLAEWDSAQAIIKRVLELDPADRSAAALRKTIADALRRRETGPRVINLGEMAERYIAEKQYLKAIDAFDSALKLDPSSETLRKRSSETRDLMDREKRAQDFLHAAKQDLANENLTRAQDNVTQCLRHDPGRADATQLLASIQSEIENRARQQRLTDGLDQSRKLLAAASYDQAVLTLQNLNAAFPDSLEVAQLLREAASHRDACLRQRQLEEGLAAVKELLRTQRHAEAVQRLESLTASFPGEDEVIKMLRYAREEWKVRQRAEALERAKAGIAQLQKDGRFDEAVQLVGRAQVEFPGDAELARMGPALAAAKAEAERQVAMEHLLLDVQSKQQKGQLIEALQLVDSGIEQHGPDQRLIGIREQLDHAWRVAQRNQALQKVIQEGRQLIGAKDWERAIALFQRVTKQFPEEAEPRKLLAEAELAHKNEIEAARKAKEREAKIQEARLKAEEEQRRRAHELEERAKEQQRLQTAKLEDALAKAYLAIGQGDLAKAAKLISEARGIDARHPGLPRAQADLETAQNLAAQNLAAQKLAAQNLAATKKAALAAEPKEPSKGVPVKGIALGIAAGVAVFGGVFFLLHKPAGPPFEITPPTASLTLTAGRGAGSPVELSATGAGPFEAKASDPWISLEPATGTLPAKIAVNANPQGLKPGNYAGAVDINAGTVKKHVAVALTVAAAVTPAKPKPDAKGKDTIPTAPPEIEISPASLSIGYTAGSPDPAARSIYLTGSGRFQTSTANPEWVSISPAAGEIPGEIFVTVHPGQLAPGTHSTQVLISAPASPNVKQVANIKLTVTAAPSKPAVKPQANQTTAPPVVNPPVVTPPTTNPPPQVQNQNPPPVEKKAAPGGLFLGGRRNGDLAWSGTLAPGAKLVITPGGASQGNVVRAPIPRDVPFDATAMSAGIQVSAAVNSLTITNVSGAAIQDIAVHWAVK